MTRVSKKTLNCKGWQQPTIATEVLCVLSSTAAFTGACPPLETMSSNSAQLHTL
ncbi:E3 ORF6/B [Mastadenovirus porcusquartum]|uniref:E3 ORF6/B n=1 Tax=Mastadenovirus porcusquartum TaxID=3241439 RepID=A0A7H0S587_9ADEN|nr:E3 ORF6/B [Porcine mastadenovirus B]QNQ79261.1 E3 ORF6/B [Porcine mastadenovirus B]